MQVWDARSGTRKGWLLVFEGGTGIVAGANGRIHGPGAASLGLSWTDGTTVHSLDEVPAAYVDRRLLRKLLAR